jgi:hypothetical protein
MATIPSIYEVGLPVWFVIAAALAVWVAFLWAVTRTFLRARERIRCPVTGTPASVVFVRAPDGAKEDIIHCSLRETEFPVTCEKECLHPAH